VDAGADPDVGLVLAVFFELELHAAPAMATAVPRMSNLRTSVPPIR
jgi:hypothetical protein